MKTIDQIKLSILIGALVVVIPLTGFPQSFKTFLLVTLGAILLYVKIIALHNEKIKEIKKAKKPVMRKSHTFVESKPIISEVEVERIHTQNEEIPSNQ